MQPDGGPDSEHHEMICCTVVSYNFKSGKGMGLGSPVRLASPKLQVGRQPANASWTDADDLKCPCECGPSWMAGWASSHRIGG